MVPPAPGCVKSASRMVPPTPGCVKNASRMVPPAPGCVKNASRMVPPAPGCVKSEDWSTSVSQFSRKPGLCENCTTLVHQCCRNFHANRKMDHCCCSFRKLQQHWSTSVAAIFARAKNATTLAPPCAKTATTMVHFARKLRQHWSKCAKNATTMVRFVRKLCQHRSPMREKCNNTGGKMCEKCVRV